MCAVTDGGRSRCVAAGRAMAWGALGAALLYVLQWVIPLILTVALGDLSSSDQFFADFLRRFPFLTATSWIVAVIAFGVAVAMSLRLSSRAEWSRTVAASIVAALSYPIVAAIVVLMVGAGGGAAAAGFGETLALSLIYGNAWPAFVISLWIHWAALRRIERPSSNASARYPDGHLR